MKKISILLIAVVAMLVSTSCSITKDVEKNAVPIAFTTLSNYYVNNTVDTKKKITKSFSSEAEFNEYFGAAAVMGANGQPTYVNWKTQYVLAVILPETDRATEAYPLSVVQNGNAVIFNYKVDKGDKQSWTRVPFTAVVLDRPTVDSQMEIFYNEK